MAETAIGLLVDRLISLLCEEAYLLREVNQQIDEIHRELRSIQAFLQRARADGDCSCVRLWVNELREEAEEIENMIPEYIQDIAEQRENQQEPNSLRKGFRYFLPSVSRFIVKLKLRHEIASKIDQLKERVLDINRRGSAYNFVPWHQTNSQTRSYPDPRDDAIFLKEIEVVGVQSDKKELLMRLAAPFPEHGVIALVGMGGIGKTTLANQVFEEAKQKFDCHAWISVSQSYSKFELLRALIKRLCESKNNESASGRIDQEMDQLALMKKMRDYLQGNSYLVIFDDVWDINFWENFKNAFPVEIGRCGNIVLTTRNVDVANLCNMSSSVHIHPMKLLNFESSLELFYSKAFHGEVEKGCPSNFVDLAQEIVKRCKGLPLAIVVLGGLVATKDKNIVEWRKLLSCLSSELEGNERLASINKIFSLSYNDFPYNLKACFLYLGIFPEYYSIRCHRLLREWFAEGFVKPSRGKTIEDVCKTALGRAN